MRQSLDVIDKEPSEFVDRVVGGLDLDDDSLHPAERFAGLAWQVVCRVSVDGWSGWIESDGHRTRELVQGLRAMGAREFAEVVEEVQVLYPASESTDVDTRLAGPSTADDWRRLQDLEQRWYRITREQDLIGAFIAPWIVNHRQEIPFSVEDL
jgi:hypothetical protein